MRQLAAMLTRMPRFPLDHTLAKLLAVASSWSDRNAKLLSEAGAVPAAIRLWERGSPKGRRRAALFLATMVTSGFGAAEVAAAGCATLFVSEMLRKASRDACTEYASALGGLTGRRKRPAALAAVEALVGVLGAWSQDPLSFTCAEHAARALHALICSSGGVQAAAVALLQGALPVLLASAGRGASEFEHNAMLGCLTAVLVCAPGAVAACTAISGVARLVGMLQQPDAPLAEVQTPCAELLMIFAAPMAEIGGVVGNQRWQLSGPEGTEEPDEAQSAAETAAIAAIVQGYDSRCGVAVILAAGVLPALLRLMGGGTRNTTKVAVEAADLALEVLVDIARDGVDSARAIVEAGGVAACLRLCGAVGRACAPPPGSC